MLRLIKVSCLLLGLVVFSNAFAAELTEESVKELITSVELAANNKNVDGIASVLSDNVEIVLNLSFNGQTQVINSNKEDYISLLKQGWSISTNYKYVNKSSDITIDGDKAFVKAVVQEMMTIQGQDISAESKEESVVELIDGTLLVTKIVGYSSL